MATTLSRAKATEGEAFYIDVQLLRPLDVFVTAPVKSGEELRRVARVLLEEHGTLSVSGSASAGGAASLTVLLEKGKAAAGVKLLQSLGVTKVAKPQPAAPEHLRAAVAAAISHELCRHMDMISSGGSGPHFICNRGALFQDDKGSRLVHQPCIQMAGVHTDNADERR